METSLDKIFAPMPQAIVKAEMELDFRPHWLKPAAKIYIDKGALGAIGETSDDTQVSIVHGDVVLSLDYKAFKKFYHTLPLPPRALRYLSFDDVFLDQKQVRWVYSFVRRDFLSIENIDLKAAGYTNRNYGCDWIALGSPSG